MARQCFSVRLQMGRAVRTTKLRANEKEDRNVKNQINIAVPDDWLAAINAVRGGVSLTDWVRLRVRDGLRGHKLTAMRYAGRPRKSKEE